jgi:aminocarboxymuconate-semialdehyde decarboxylase
MAAIGITVRYLSVPPILYAYELDPSTQADSVTRLNDWLISTTDSPGFRATATLPLGNLDASFRELDRITASGVSSVAIGTHVAGHALDLAVPDELWAALAENTKFVLLHPWQVRLAGLLQDAGLTNPVGNPVETTIAATRLITAGVISRHPGLTILLAHGGGCLPYLLGRLHHAHAMGLLKGPDPDECARKFVYDTVVFDPLQLRHLVDVVGPDCVVVGTDSPFDMAIANPAALAAAIDWVPTRELCGCGRQNRALHR